MIIGYRLNHPILMLVTLVVVNCFTLTGSTEEVVIDFNSDDLGDRIGSFVSVDSPLATFNAYPLRIRSGLREFDGTGIETAFSEGITIDFAIPIISLSILFGNDDPGFPEDRALLLAFRGSELIGQETLLFNRNDLPDQTITFSTGEAFDRAVFDYVDSSLTPASGLGEVISEVRFQLVPEPSSLTLGAILSLSMLVGIRRMVDRRME